MKITCVRSTLQNIYIENHMCQTYFTKYNNENHMYQTYFTKYNNENHMCQTYFTKYL